MGKQIYRKAERTYFIILIENFQRVFKVVSKMVLTSSAGILALLDDEEPKLKSFALGKLSAKYDSYVTVLDVFWMEIADKIQTLEMLSEDTDFADRRLAALVASKVHYHLESYD